MIHVLCFGNPWHGDDGFGHHVHRRLAERALPENVRLFDVGTRGLDALHLLEGCRWAVLVDALRADGPPGGLKLLVPEDLAVEEAPVGHAVGIGGLLRAARAVLPELPRIDVLGTVAAAIAPFREELSAPVAVAVEDAAAFLGDQLARFASGGEPGWRGLEPLEDLSPVAWAGPPRWTGTARLPGPPRRTEILVVAHAGRLAALRARCPHLGMPLAAAGVVNGTHLECPRDGKLLPLASGWRVVERADSLLLVLGTEGDCHG